MQNPASRRGLIFSASSGRSVMAFHNRDTYSERIMQKSTLVVFLEV